MPETNIVTNAIKNSYFSTLNSMKNLTFDEYCFYAGYVYSAKDYFTLGINSTVYIHFTGNNASGYSIVFKPLLFQASDAGPVTIDYYANTVLTPGGRTPITSFNRNSYAFVGGVTSIATIEFVNVANISDIGNKFTGALVSSQSGLGAAAGQGAAGGEELPLLVYMPDDYVICITNTDTVNPTLFEYNFTWIEYPKEIGYEE